MPLNRQSPAINDAPPNWIDRISKVSDVLVFGLAGLWCTLLFGIYSWPAWSQGFDATALIVVDPYSDFSDKSGWLPIAMEVAKGRLFPVTSTSGDVLNGLSYYPYLSLWLFGLLVALIGPGIALVASQVIFPTAVFILSALTFRLYLPRRWALMLAALGVMAYSRYPLRDFLVEIVTGSGWRQLGAVFRPDLANVPFPAISAFAFVAIFYLTMRNHRLTGRWITALTVAWALQTQVHLINALFGIPFWLTYMPLRLWLQRRNDGNNIADVLRIWGGQVLITALISAPALAGLAGWFNSGLGSADLFGGAASASNAPSKYYFAAYFVLPILLTMLVATVRRIDPFEVLTRFWPIILFMLLELILALLLPLLKGTGPLTELIFSRIGIFFLHMLYFVPLIHYAVRPHGTVQFSSGVEAKPIAIFLRGRLRWLFHDASLIYLPLLFVVLTQFAVASGEQALAFQNQRAPAAKEIQARLDLLAKYRDGNKILVADENLATNLNLHLIDYASLINNRFANQISVEDALERMGLYSHAVGWDEAAFLRFMLPKEEYRGLPWDEVLDWTKASSVRGFGYWLVFHQHHLSQKERQELEIQLHQLFVTTDFASVAKRVGLKYVLSSQEPPADLHPSPMATTPYGILYHLNIAKVDHES